MIFAVVLVGLLASATAADWNVKPYRFTPGQTYMYGYSARLLTGIPKIADQFSNFQIKADIVIQARGGGSNEVKLRLANIRAGHVDQGSSRPDDSSLPQWSSEHQKELTKPIVFTHVNGKVVDFSAERTEPEWSINIKKSILSLFNLNLEAKDVLRVPKGNLLPKPVSQADLSYYGVFEQGMGGECETTYELNQIPSAESTSEELLLNVTKTRNYGNCITRPVLVKENFSLQHSEQHREQSWSAVKGYYPVPSSTEQRKHKQRPAQIEELDGNVKQYNSVKYNISMSSSVAVIEGIYSEGRVVYNTFGDKIMAITQQNVTLKNQPEENRQTLQIAPLSHNSEKHEELSFLLPKMAQSGSPSEQIRMDIPHMALYGPINPSELVRKMTTHFENLAREILSSQSTVESKEAMQRVIEIVNTLASLQKEDLEKAFKEIAEPAQDRKAASLQQQTERQLFLDCLALSGTNDAAMLIREKIIGHYVSSNEARQLLEALPHNMYLPDVKTTDAYLELCQHPRVVNRPVVHTAASVCFGKLVQIGSRKAESVRPAETRKYWATVSSAEQDDSAEESSEWEEMFAQKTVTPQDVERYVVVAGRLLEQADTFQKKVAAIEMLAHMGAAEVLNYLKPYITGKAPLSVVPGYEIEEGQNILKERNYLRTIAIYATAHVAKRFPKQVQPMLLSVYRHSSEPHQMRLAAFTIFMLCQPEQHILQSIASDLHRESDKQIVAFVTSALKSTGSLQTPCLQELAKAAADAADSAPKGKQSWEFSRYAAKDYFDAKKSFGLLGVAEIVQSRRSPIPKAGYLSLIETTGQFHEQFLEIGFNAKGLEKLVHRIAGRNGLIASIVQNNHVDKTQKKNMIPIDEAVRVFRQRISSTLNYDNAQDSARLNVFFKLFERTSVYALDEAALFDMIEEVEAAVDDWAGESVSQGYTGTFARVFMPSSLLKVLPSELGLPVVVSHKNPVILSVTVNNAKLEHRNSGFQVSAEIVPKCLHSSYTFLFGVLPGQKTAVGTHVEKTTQASLPLKFRVAYKKPENKWTVSMQPETDQEVFYHKTEAKTFVSQIHVATTPAREWLQTAKSIRNAEATSAKMQRRLTHKNLPVAAQISLETEEKLQDRKSLEKKVQKNGLVQTAVQIFQNPGLNAREVHVYLETRDDQPTTFDYEWDMQQAYEEEGSSQKSAHHSSRAEQQQGQTEREASDELYNSEESQDSLVEDIFSRISSAIGGQMSEDNEDRKTRPNAGRWMQKATENLKWAEDYKDYESEAVWTPLATQQEELSKNSCQTMRTLHVRDGERICFSTRPVFSCDNSCRPESEKEVSVEFHCLPQASAFTLQLMKDSERMVLKQLINKRVDFRRTIAAPLACSA